MFLYRSLQLEIKMLHNIVTFPLRRKCYRGERVLKTVPVRI